jgi:hypothetical protein
LAGQTKRDGENCMGEIFKIKDNQNESIVDRVKRKIMCKIKEKKGCLILQERDDFYHKELNPLEREVFVEAVNSLIEDGVLKTNSNNDLELTEIGARLIY